MNRIEGLAREYVETRNDELFNEIYQVTQGHFISISKKEVGKVDEDLIQELNIVLIKCLDNYDVNKNTPFIKYLNKIVSFRVMNYLKEHVYFDGNLSRKDCAKYLNLKGLDDSEINEKEIAERDMLEMLAYRKSLDDGDDLEVETIDDHEGLILSEIKALLTDEEKDILEMLRLNYAVKDISIKFNKPKSTIKSKIGKIKRTLVNNGYLL